MKLRQIALTEAPSALERASAQAGIALRRAHAANPFSGAAGEIVGKELRPFDTTWPEWNAHEIMSHTARLRELDEIDVEAATRIERICGRLPELLGNPAPALVHTTRIRRMCSLHAAVTRGISRRGSTGSTRG